MKTKKDYLEEITFLKDEFKFILQFHDNDKLVTHHFYKMGMVYLKDGECLIPYCSTESERYQIRNFITIARNYLSLFKESLGRK